MREIHLFHNRFVLHPDRVLIWPDQNLLVAADLHLGRAETYLSSSIDEPQQEQWRGLVALETLANQFAAQRILLLGDFLHSPHGLTEGIVQDFSDFLLRTEQDVSLIAGQKDKGVLKLLNALFPKLEVLFQWQIENFIFQHQPPLQVPPNDEEFYWCGHQNPVCGGQACFVIDSRVGVLPAYSPIPDGTEVDESSGRTVFLCN